MEGYLYDRDDAKAAFRHAAAVAHSAGRMVSLTLSDSFCVDRHRDDFRSLVSDEVDLLFGNESELIALYQTDTFEQAVAELRRHCQLAAVTVGAEGSVIVTADELIQVPAVPVRKVIDTTGAGDLYAAGFLHGLTPATAQRVRPLRIDRGRRGDLPRGSPAAGRAAYAGRCDQRRVAMPPPSVGWRPNPTTTSETSCTP